MTCQNLVFSYIYDVYEVQMYVCSICRWGQEAVFDFGCCRVFLQQVSSLVRSGYVIYALFFVVSCVMPLRTSIDTIGKADQWGECGWAVGPAVNVWFCFLEQDSRGANKRTNILRYSSTSFADVLPYRKRAKEARETLDRLSEWVRGENKEGSLSPFQTSFELPASLRQGLRKSLL